jgi:hypothetical protein
MATCLEPKESQYPTVVDTDNGQVTVLRHRQIYQHIQLKISYEGKCGYRTDFAWITLADNCKDGFAVDDDRASEPVLTFLRTVAKAWLTNWEAITGV